MTGTRLFLVVGFFYSSIGKYIKTDW